MSNPNCFRGYPPTTVLGSYILDKWSDFSTLSSETRIRIRCIFDLFFSRMLWPTHFLQIIESHYPNMLAAATILAKTRERRQIQCFTQCFPVTNKEKTLVLLSSYEMLSQVEWIGFLGLTRVQAYDRIRHVVSRLEEKGMLNDSSSSSKKIFQIVQCGEVTIATHVKDDLGILKARLMREQHARRKHDIQMRLALVRLNKKIHNMEQQLCERHVGDNDESDDDQDSEENVITDSFFKELSEYGTRPGQARRYSSRFLQVSEVLYLTSRKAYQILRQLLPFPSPGCLKSHFSETLATIKYMLTDSELVPEHISNVLPKCSANPVFVTLAADAFAYQTFHETSTFRSLRPSKSGYSNAFVYMCIPLDACHRPTVLHLMSKENGSFDCNVMDRFVHITKLCRERNMKVLFAATDGDRYLGPYHEAFFAEYVQEYVKDFSYLIGNIYETLLSKDEVMPVADPLHLAKNLRGKLLDHKIAVVHEKNFLFTTAKTLNEVLNLDMVLLDTSNLGRMRDFYVTSLFTLQNVCRLMEAKNYHSALLLLPYSCIFTVLYSPNITGKTRLFLTNLAYNIFLVLSEEANSLVTLFKTVKYRYTRGAEAIVFAEPDFITRMLHTCLALGIAVNYGPPSTRLDAVGTHLVENAIGIARTVSNSCQFSRIVSAFANSELRKTLAREAGLTLYVSRRINDGGAKINTGPGSSDEVSHPKTWDPRDIASLLREACHSQVKDTSRNELLQFQRELQDFTRSVKIRNMSKPSIVANCCIAERNKHYSNGLNQ